MWAHQYELLIEHYLSNIMCKIWYACSLDLAWISEPQQFCFDSSSYSYLLCFFIEVNNAEEDARIYINFWDHCIYNLFLCSMCFEDDSLTDQNCVIIIISCYQNRAVFKRESVCMCLSFTVLNVLYSFLVSSLGSCKSKLKLTDSFLSRWPIPVGIY